MDNRAQVREFLISRRERITPAQAGLPAYGGGNRRVKGLRREEVALLAGVSIDYYLRMERGNLAGASDAVLDGIARALQLDEAERAQKVPACCPYCAFPMLRVYPRSGRVACLRGGYACLDANGNAPVGHTEIGRLGPCIIWADGLVS